MAMSHPHAMVFAITLLLVCCAIPSSAFNLAPSLLPSHRSVSSSLSTSHPLARQLRSRRPQNTIVAVSTRDEGGSTFEQEPAVSAQVPTTKSKEDKVRDVQNAAFLIGSVVSVAAIVLFYSTGRDSAIAGPMFKVGASTFFLGVVLQYAETYNKCTYIRFVREGLLNPASVVRRWQRIMYKVDGNLFRFFLPGRSYDVIDGKPVQRPKE